VKHNPDYISGDDSLPDGYLRNGDQNKAVEIYKKIIQIDPESIYGRRPKDYLERNKSDRNI